MFRRSVLIVLVATLVGIIAAGKEEEKTRMTNSGKISIFQAPYIVSIRDLRRKGMHNCGGTLITPRFVITAAHCVTPGQHPDVYMVVGDATTLSEAGERRRVEAFFRHPEYNPKLQDKDIAIIKLASDMTGRFVKPIELCDTHLNETHMLQVSGWGVTRFGGSEPSDHLRSARIPVLSQEECLRRHEKVPNAKITDSMVCAIGEGGVDACTTDSGGPGIFNQKLCATVSWGVGCGRSDSYSGVYVRIDTVRDFIDEYMEKMK